jgi:hypothetical protein
MVLTEGELRSNCKDCESFPAPPHPCLPIELAISFAKSEEWWTMETKYLRLRIPVELGSRFDNWQVCWLGGWSKHRLYYLVMLVKVPFKEPIANRPAPNPGTGRKKRKQKTPPGKHRRR